MLHYTALHYTTLHYTILDYINTITILYYTILYCTTLSPDSPRRPPGFLPPEACSPVVPVGAAFPQSNRPRRRSRQGWAAASDCRVVPCSTLAAVLDLRSLRHQLCSIVRPARRGSACRASSGPIPRGRPPRCPPARPRVANTRLP